METEHPYVNSTGNEDNKMEVDDHDTAKEKVLDDAAVAGPSSGLSPVSKNRCLPQRAALIKAVLSFLKKSIPDPSFSESIRNGTFTMCNFYIALHCVLIILISLACLNKINKIIGISVASTEWLLHPLFSL